MAVAIVAVLLVCGFATHHAFWWSWRAIVQRPQWKNITTFAEAVGRAEMRDRAMFPGWRASRMRIADEYRKEAARLRASSNSHAVQARAADYEQFAKKTTSEAGMSRVSLATAQSMRLRDKLGRVDLIDFIILFVVCAIAGSACLLFPGFRARLRSKTVQSMTEHSAV